MIARAALLALALLAAGCGEEEAAPPPGPVAMTALRWGSCRITRQTSMVLW